MPTALPRFFLIPLCLHGELSLAWGSGGAERIFQVHKSTMIGISVQLKRLVQPFDATLYSGSCSNEAIKKLV